MSSNNTLLGFSKGKVEMKVKMNEVNTDFESPMFLYRNDWKKGKIFRTLKEQEKALKDNWVDSPAKIKSSDLDNSGGE